METLPKPAQAEYLSLLRSLRRAEERALEDRIRLARERSRRKGSQAALNREHAKVLLSDREADAALEDAEMRVTNVQADAQVLEDTLLAVASELDRVARGGVTLKTPADALEFVQRVRSLIPTSGDASEVAIQVARARLDAEIVPPTSHPCASGS
jgi:hypothetical protein